MRGLQIFVLLVGASGVPLLAPGRVGKMESVRDHGHAAAAQKRRRFSLGLRARVTVAFAIAGLIVAVGLSLITYSLARSFLLQQRDTAARTQAYSNARFVKDRLRDPHTDVGRVVNDVRTEGGGSR